MTLLIGCHSSKPRHIEEESFLKRREGKTDFLTLGGLRRGFLSWMRENCFPSCKTLSFALSVYPLQSHIACHSRSTGRHCNSSLPPSKKPESEWTPPSCWMMGLQPFISYNFPWQTSQSKISDIFWRLLRAITGICQKKQNRFGGGTNNVAFLPTCHICHTAEDNYYMHSTQFSPGHAALQQPTVVKASPWIRGPAWEPQPLAGLWNGRP